MEEGGADIHLAASGIFKMYLLSKSAAMPSGMNSRYCCQFWAVIVAPTGSCPTLAAAGAALPAVPAACARAICDSEAITKAKNSPEIRVFTQSPLTPHTGLKKPL